jgi:asparagine synthetase B (glutamine-hydrolysing)
MSERLYEIGRRVPWLSAAVAHRVIGSDAGDRLLRVLHARDRATRYAEILTVLRSEEVDAIVPGGTPAAVLAREVVARWMPADAERDSVNALLTVDARMSLADDLLLVADHFSMAASVELRVPFLDLALLELLDRMPSRYKVSWTGRRKWLYRKAALAKIPTVLTRSLGGARSDRGRKVGFRTPVDRWFGADSTLDPAWSEQLLGIPALDARLARRSCTSGRRPKRVRQQLALYALAKWYA